MTSILLALEKIGTIVEALEMNGKTKYPKSPTPTSY
jgi:hypothetical protein